MNKFLKNALALAMVTAALVLSPALAADDNPMVPDMIEQYGRVLDNINNADTLSDIPDPIDAEPDVEEPDAPEPDVSEPSNTSENMDWENRHPNGPF